MFHYPIPSRSFPNRAFLPNHSLHASKGEVFHSQHTIVVQRRRQTPLHSPKTPSQSRRPKPKSAKTASPTVSSIIRRRAFDVTASNPTPQLRRPLRTPTSRAPLRTEPSRRRSRRRRRLRRRRIRETVRPKSITRTQLDRPRRAATTTTTTPTLVIAARTARSRPIVEAKRSRSWRSVSRRFRDFSTASLVFASSRFANNVDREMWWGWGWVWVWVWGWGWGWV